MISSQTNEEKRDLQTDKPEPKRGGFLGVDEPYREEGLWKKVGRRLRVSAMENGTGGNWGVFGRRG